MSSNGSSSSALVVKAVHAGSTRRLTFNSLPRLDFVTFRSKVAATFSLPPAGCKFSFTDDDGDEIDISSQSCLREAIAFFSEEDTSSNASSRSSSSRCVMRINVSLEYDGPGLSDYEASLDSESAPSRDHRSSRRRGSRADVASRSEKGYAASELRPFLGKGTGYGKQELSQRWFAQLPQTRRGASSSIEDPLRPNGMTLGPTACCSACHAVMEDLRYVCTVCWSFCLSFATGFQSAQACGPSQAEAALSDDGTQRDAPSHADLPAKSTREADEDHETSSSDSSSESGEAGDAISPATSLGIPHDAKGYELCSACVQSEGAAHAHSTSAPRHDFQEIIRDDQGAWREVVFDDAVDCSSCGSQIASDDRHKCLTCARFDLCGECFSRPGNLHAGHCFQSSLEKPKLTFNSASLGPPVPLHQRVQLYRALGSTSASTRSLLSRSSSLRSKSTARHIDCMCFGCLKEVIGIRYHCSECQIDLCETCEGSDPATIMPQSDHEPSHILLKIALPLSDPTFLHDAGDRARHLGRSGRGGRRGRSPGEERERWHPHPLEHGPPPFHRNDPHGRMEPPHRGGDFGPPRHFPDGFGPPPHGPPVHHGHGPPPWGRHHRPPPHVYLINAGSNGSGPQAASMSPLMPVLPTSTCGGCSSPLLGERWICTSCPGPPFELCSSCEKRNDLHDPAHVFAHLRTAPSRPLPPAHRLLPPLYLESLLDDTCPVHESVQCDGCAQSIKGIWHHCGTCIESFDLCSRCYASQGARHDERHAFLAFKRAVDLSAFRSLSQNGTEPVPLLPLPSL